MQRILPIVITLLTFGIGSGQTFHAGFRPYQLKDSARIYKPDTELVDNLHYRPVDLDIWYPSNAKKGKALMFRDLFNLFEQRAVNYQDNMDYSGITNELAQYYVAELGLGEDSQTLLNVQTNSFYKLVPSEAKMPVILYMAGLNGMGFENYKILEKLAQNGFLVVSIWSVGRYPGDMTNQKEDMLEQVYDAEFAIRYLRENKPFNADFNSIGIIGCSWGGMSSAVFIDRNPNTEVFVSLDGTETHYFGEEDENDRFIQEIRDSKLFNPKNHKIKYLYLESGDKLNEFQPSKEYNYFRELKSEKYYLRFTNSSHADFSCIPSILDSSENSVQIYANIEKLTLAFLTESFENQEIFKSVWENVSANNYVTDELYDLSGNAIKTNEIKGVVLDNENDEPLPYVNIGVLNKESGTVSDAYGEFTFDLKEEFTNDTIRISSIGYEPIEILVKDLVLKTEPITIKMEEQISELNEVIINAKTVNKKILGNKTQSNLIGTGFSYDQLGAEMGIRINIRKNPTFVDAFNFFISYNKLSAESIFRLNIYNLDKGKPSENILKENILIPIKAKRTGSVHIDLRPYDIILSEDVIVTLEWVENKGKNNKGEAIFFPLGLFSNGTIYKYSSQGKFKKFSSMGVGFNFDVRY